MSVINFHFDLRIFATRLRDDLIDAAAQTASAGRLPTMNVSPGLVEAREHLLEVAAHLNSDTTYQGSPLELHVISVASRAMRLASAFACEDLAAERSGRRQILTTDEWREVHRGVVNGCAGQMPLLHRNGTPRPPRWAIDLLQLTARLAEVGWGQAEVRIRERAMGEPSRDERRVASEVGNRMINLKNEHLRQHPELLAEARAWARANSQHILPRPRPAGCLAIDNLVWVRLGSSYRTPHESAAVAAERREKEITASAQTRIIAGRVQNPIRVDAEVHDILSENRRQAADHARNANRSRGHAVA